MTFYDIEKLLTTIADRRSSGFTLHDFFSEEIKNLKDLKDEIIPAFHEELNKLDEFELVDTDDSDCDGYNEVPIWRVYYFKTHDVYVKVFGFWTSSSGSEFEKMKEVKPITKTITVYE